MNELDEFVTSRDNIVSVVRRIRGWIGPSCQRRLLINSLYIVLLALVGFGWWNAPRTSEILRVRCIEGQQTLSFERI